MENRVTTHEAAKILECSPNHVRYLERTGQLPTAPRVGIYNKRMLDRPAVEQLARDRLCKGTGYDPGDQDPFAILET